MVTIYEIARARFTVQYCIKCLFDQFFQLLMILKISDDIERTKMSVIDDVKVIETIGATVLRNIFQEKVKNESFFIRLKNKTEKRSKFSKVVWYFILRKITRFCAIWKKIYLYTSASAFSEILQRLKQNSKTSCDLGKLPTEVGVKILKCLDATGRSSPESFYVGERRIRHWFQNRFWLGLSLKLLL